IGDLLPALAEKLGVTGTVPVYCGIHDSNASLLPHLMTRTSPFSVISTGTWVVAFGVGGALERLDPTRDTLANVDAYGRAVPSARFMGGREFDQLTLGSAVEPDAETLANIITRQIMVLPSVVRGSGPFPDREMRWVNGEPKLVPDRNAAASLY